MRMSQNQLQEAPTRSATPAKAANSRQRYSWTRQPFHENQKQLDWSDLAVAIFNVDVHDILLKGPEKRLVLSYLTKELMSCEEDARRISNNSWTTTVRAMCKGLSRFQPLKMYGVLLRYQLSPPESWYVSDEMCRCLGALRYLERCTNGRDIYTKERVRDPPVGLWPDGLEDNHSYTNDFEGRRTSHTKAASKEWSPSVDAGTPPPASPRRITRSVSKLGNPINPDGHFVLHPVEPRPSAETPHTPTQASRKHKIITRTTPSSPETSQKVSPKAKPDTPSCKIDKQRCRSTDNAEEVNPDPPRLSATLHQMKRVKQEHSITRLYHGWIAGVLDTVSVLDRVALYDAQSVRQLALDSLVTDLDAAGWDDLKESIEQIIKDVDRESRVFLADKVVAAVYHRIDLAVNESSTDA